MGYGEWKSPITLGVVTAAKAAVQSAVIDPDSGKLFWDIKKPTGQIVVCTWEHDKACEWTPEEFDVVSRVHEYGGGAYFAFNDVLYFVDKTDQRLYRQDTPSAKPVPITADFGAGLVRYAGGHMNKSINHIVMVREDHRIENAECINTIVCINPETGDQTVICEGADFYTGATTFEENIMFVSWMHPNMPWDVTSLHEGRLSKNSGQVSIENLRCVVTGCSILQPQLYSNDEYLYLTDKTGYYNVWKSVNNDTPWLQTKGESGYPYGWIFGMPGYSVNEHVNGIVIGAKEKLMLVDLQKPQVVKKDLTEIAAKEGFKFNVHANVMCHKNFVYFCGISDSAHMTTLICIDLNDDSLFVYNDSAAPGDLKPYISFPELVSFPTTENSTAWGYLYKPLNPDYSPDDKELPPLLVKIHGGPTGMTNTSLNMKIQYFTSRGFAVLDIDYRGSTGYGREYRQALYGKWGIYDIDDAVSGAEYLVAQGIVDEKRLAVDGGSAGGYTAMAVMVFKDIFHASTSYYGVSDLLGLAKCTHKFESRYLDKMIGKLPEDEAVYKARSPINHCDKLTGAIAFLQGLDDFVVPPAQSVVMYEAAVAKKVPTFLIEFEGEAHGFKKAGTIQRCLESEIYFYSKLFGFQLADPVETPPDIKNL